MAEPEISAVRGHAVAHRLPDDHGVAVRAAVAREVAGGADALADAGAEGLMQRDRQLDEQAARVG